MEFSIGSNDVFLSLHPTYCAEDDGSILQAVSKYKPLVDWLTRYQPDTYKISRITVRNIQWIAKRIAVLAVDVELTNGERQKLVQSCTFTDDAKVVLLPVLSLNGHLYGVVIRQRRVALGGEEIEEAITGTVGKEGFVGTGSEVLSQFGFKLGGNDLVALRGSTPFSLGEGLATASLVKATSALSPDDARPLLDGIAVDGGVVVARPLAQLASTARDLKVLVAASLVKNQ